MSAMSDYLENHVLDSYFRNTTLSRPATIYVALFTAAPNDGGGGTEVSGGGYARQGLDTGASSDWDAASGGVVANTAAITFPTATANWGTVSHVGLFDASSGGNLLFHGALSTAKAVDEDDVFSFPAGALQISLA